MRCRHNSHQASSAIPTASSSPSRPCFLMRARSERLREKSLSIGSPRSVASRSSSARSAVPSSYRQVEVPPLPARAVRPMRCMNSTAFGATWYWTTCATSAKSIPREASPVQTSTCTSPAAKAESSAARASGCTCEWKRPLGRSSWPSDSAA
eukprot:scaffold104659_cov69-Phaeocystis_antarctica.AAC.2